jgi:phosphoglycerol transferase MdoB-like AlkP superfamily enzyme
MIMTSSNHPPYSLDLKKEGCPLTSVPTAYQKEFPHGNATLKMLGHHWYSDKWLGYFVREFSKKNPDSLFAITGDHWGRIFPGPRPTSFEKAIVPLVLYGPNILPKDISGDRLSGGHYDLGATLIELAADPGFSYHAIGKNILKTTPKNVAMSRIWFLGHDFISLAKSPQQTQSLKGESIPAPADLPKLKRRYNLTHGISWWRLRKGNDLPTE